MRQVATLVLTLTAIGAATARAADPPAVRLDLVAGDAVRGRLVAVEAESIRILADGAERSVPVASVRRLVREGDPPPRPTAVLVTMTDGGELSGTGFLQDGPRAFVLLGDGRIELPAERVRRVAWPEPGRERPEWADEAIERPRSDLVVVRRDAGHAFVECAIAGVSADGATVVLDGETIPVKQAKLLGLEWLRGDAVAGGTPVDVDGGRLSARSVRWSPEAFTLDDVVLVPPGAVRAIDFAAGRTTPLADASIERASCEPFFAALVDQPGLAAFFKPRLVPGPGDGPATLVVRPRTAVTWRVPADSRRFRGSLERDVPAQAAAAVDVSLAVDDTEVFRRRLGGPAADAAERSAVDLDLAGARRLTLTVDFVAGDIGCGVRLVAGAFEK